MLRKISNILILIGIIGVTILTFINIKQIKTNEIIISNIEYDNISQYYVGYVDFLNRKIPLVYGTSSKKLDQNIVGIDNHSTSSHLILAGHAIPSVFLPLYYIELNSEIIIYLNEIKKYYIVDNIKIVNKSDVSIYNNEDLTLITCINKEKRLIIHAKTAN